MRLFDVYRDPVRIGKGKKSMAFALTYRSDDHTLTSEEVEKAHQLYRQHGLGARDDAIAMQYLIPGWTFDPKRPCMVR